MVGVPGLLLGSIRLYAGQNDGFARVRSALAALPAGAGGHPWYLPGVKLQARGPFATPKKRTDDERTHRLAEPGRHPKCGFARADQPNALLVRSVLMLVASVTWRKALKPPNPVTRPRRALVARQCVPASPRRHPGARVRWDDLRREHTFGWLARAPPNSAFS